MRTLVLFRGAPGCGKTTFIKEHFPVGYTLSPDEMRLMYSSPQRDIDGHIYVSQAHNKKVWKTIREIAEERFKRGEFTIIDATNSHTHEMSTWKSLAGKYNYKVYLIDMTYVPIEKCKLRNALRPSLEVVPEEVIDRMYMRFQTQPVPRGITVLDPIEINEVYCHLHYADKYDAVNVIGDVHGCYTALMKLIDHVKKSDNELFVFVGDLCDRGVENADVVKFFIETAGLDNFLYLEGNHEAHLRKWSKGEKVISKEFNLFTAPQLTKARIKKKELRNALDKLGQCYWFEFDEKRYFVSHGGISRCPDMENPVYISAEELIKGTGNYEDVYVVENAYQRNSVFTSFQIHGHRNPENRPVYSEHNSFNLEGKVELGGELRAVRLEKGKAVRCVSIKNDVVRRTEENV